MKETGKKLHDIGFGNNFLDVTPKAQVTKVKINKLNFIKIKNFCASKGTINRMKRQPTEWEKIFANNMTDKGLIAKIYKQLNSIQQKETTQSKNR